MWESETNLFLQSKKEIKFHFFNIMNDPDDKEYKII